MRLDKILAHMGFGSRKEVKEYIRKGYVMINGQTIKDDDFKVDPQNDEIVFLDEDVRYEEMIYLIMNKPQGYVSATYDSKEATVLDLIEGYDKRHLFPIGRLDKDTTGLLILTNDGQLAHQLLSPTKHVDKVYELTFRGEFKDTYFKEFEDGIVLDDGYKCLPAKFVLIGQNHGLITIKEGKYHQVKRMMQALGMEVTTLKRIKFGGLDLPTDITEGSYRKMTSEELGLIISK